VGDDPADEHPPAVRHGVQLLDRYRALAVEVFADELEPAPVRERAFGLLAMQISSGRRRSEFTLAA